MVLLADVLLLEKVLRTHLNDMQRLLHAPLNIKGKARIHLRRHLARHNLQDLAAKLHEQVVERGVDLRIDALGVLLAVRAGLVDELRVFGLLRGGEDERGVGGGVLRLVFANGGEVARVADDGLWCGNVRRCVVLAADWMRRLGAGGRERMEGRCLPCRLL